MDSFESPPLLGQCCAVMAFAIGWVVTVGQLHVGCSLGHKWKRTPGLILEDVSVQLVGLHIHIVPELIGKSFLFPYCTLGRIGNIWICNLYSLTEELSRIKLLNVVIFKRKEMHAPSPGFPNTVLISYFFFLNWKMNPPPSNYWGPAFNNFF